VFPDYAPRYPLIRRLVFHEQNRSFERLSKRAGREKYRKAAGPILDKAIRLHQAGIAREAQALCFQILENLPDHFDALRLLGASKLGTKELEEAGSPSAACT
jgi:hypothetical protein